MIWLKLHSLEGVPQTINMARVDLYHTDGSGHTVFVYDDESFYKVKESAEEVDDMLHAALIGFRGIVSRDAISTVVR